MTNLVRNSTKTLKHLSENRPYRYSLPLLLLAACGHESKSKSVTIEGVVLKSYLENAIVYGRSGESVSNVFRTDNEGNYKLTLGKKYDFTIVETDEATEVSGLEGAPLQPIVLIGSGDGGVLSSFSSLSAVNEALTDTKILEAFGLR